ncbi:MAG TPA: hypothetical protein VFG74_02865 [Miltoncostaeaceae bacterium]|nr:hypothetical protein [Miltoncostaeaceae bacterium]
MDLDEYRSEAEEHLRSPGPAADARHAGLFTAERVTDLTALAASGGTRMRNLARYAAEGHLRLASATEVERIAQELRAPMPGNLTLLEVDGARAAERSADRRRELQAERLRAIGARLPSAVSDAEAHRTLAAHELGAATPADLIARAAGLDLRAAAALGAATLDAGDDAVGRRVGERDAADLPRLLRAPELDDALPAAGAGGALERTCELLGLAAPAVAPGVTGLAGYAEALRLGGLALAAAGTAARLPVEARRLGDPALAHATAFLLEGLLAEPAWIVRVLDAADAGRVAGPAGTLRLLATRAAAARAAALAGGSREDLMSRALGLAWPGELTLLDGLAGVAAADAIRARALAALLRRHLRETSGDRWFADPRAGALLQELWLEGGDLTPEDVARDLGADGLDPSALVAEAV